jgi:Gluconate 2-dehydrogenase subunit 3
VPRFLTEHEYAAVNAAADRLIPPAGAHPGGAALGVADYVDHLLGAFTFDPPLIFAGGPFSGRAGGDASFGDFLPLSRHEELAWRTRIEGSRGMVEREFNGPVLGWQEIYRQGIAALGADFTDVDGGEQDRRLASHRELRQLLYEHACEGAYGPPEYGGNRDLAGWHAIEFPGDSQPRGYTDEEVSGRA